GGERPADHRVEAGQAEGGPALLADRGDAYGPVVHEGAAAPHRVVGLALGREAADPDRHLAFRFERDQDAPGGYAAQEVAGAVDGVDDPAAAAPGRGPAALLAQQAVLGEGGGELGRDVGLGGAVRGGDRRVVRLVLGFDSA